MLVNTPEFQAASCVLWGRQIHVLGDQGDPIGPISQSCLGRREAALSVMHAMWRYEKVNP